ncbi:hypothetical protein HY373_01565 [Candidatus Berkelbacteria bacterium]|nr:hypothetical protein [Candidatus Berkelbacteria bacterium]MBI2588186.1 hypothetical protein [Candidatus Berkelbacteria bacterium]MBI4029846.1 hypothetical protein [Candidatus Berkelbacteria bacterium]
MLKKLTNQNSRHLPEKISWEASEFPYYSKGGSWLGLIILSGIILAFIFIYLKSYLAAVVALLSAAVFIIQGKAKPRVIKYQLDAEGVKIDESVWPYSEFMAFYFGSHSVYLKKTKKLALPIALQLNGQDPQKILDFLALHLPTHPKLKEETTAKISRFLKL